MLEIKSVNAFYGNSRAVNDVSLNVQSGEFLSILGRNGVGKTSLMRAVIGLMDRITGSIKLDGVEINNKKTHERAIAGIGYVPQGRGILPKFTVRENLQVGTFATSKDKKSTEINEWVFELFPILKEFLNRPGGDLSGGQQQQLAIARALLTEPKVMLLDEPTEGIQPNIVEKIEEILIDLNSKHGMTLILVEQNVDFARRASQKFAILENGIVASKGKTDSLTDELVHKHLSV
ncbi:MAG: urea ABC transporter ATP-binding subunit UrtE [Gammaproteobacteria bacterium]